VLRLTDGGGVDLVVETGGASTLGRSLNAAVYGGTVFDIGFLRGTLVPADVIPIIVKALHVQGNNTGSVEDPARRGARDFGLHESKPVVDRAHMAVDGKHFDKLAIRSHRSDRGPAGPPAGREAGGRSALSESSSAWPPDPCPD
jgi:NADPH:quinone reductase-like Zn-dependent oxidoreductase